MRVWDVAGGAEAIPMLEHRNVVRAVEFSPDGAWIATAGDDHTARVWSARTGAPRTPPLPHEDRLSLVRFSPDGTLLLTAGERGAAVWSDGDRRASIPHARPVADAVFSADGKRVATIDEDGSARIWNAGSGEPASPVLASADPEGSARRPCVRFDADGSRLLTSNGRTIEVWDARTGASLAGPWRMRSCARVEFVHGGQDVLGVDGEGGTEIFGPGWPGRWLRGNRSVSSSSLSGNRLALAGRDGLARVFDVASDAARSPELRHSGAVEAVEISGDGKRLATLDVVGILRVWDLEETPARVLDEGDASMAFAVLSAGFDSDGTRVLTVVPDRNAAHLWNAATGEPLFEFAGEAPVDCARISPDGRRAATGGRDGSLRLFDTGSSEAIGDAMEHPGGVRCLAFSPDGGRLVSGGREGGARIWTIADRTVVTIEHAGPIVDVAFAPDANTVLVAGGASARLYDPVTGARVTEGPRQNEEGLLSAALSPDGLRIATGGMDGVARVWNARTGEPVTPPLVHSGGPKVVSLSQRVNHVAFSPDSKRLATSSHDGATHLWDAATGAAVAPALADGDAFAAFSPDGRWVATAGASGAIRVWDARSGAPISSPLLHEDAAATVEFDRTGLRLVSAGWDGTARIWELAPDERPVAALRNLAEVLAARRVDASGGIVDLTVDELRERWTAQRGK